MALALFLGHPSANCAEFLIAFAQRRSSLIVDSIEVPVVADGAIHDLKILYPGAANYSEVVRDYGATAKVVIFAYSVRSIESWEHFTNVAFPAIAGTLTLPMVLVGLEDEPSYFRRSAAPSPSLARVVLKDYAKIAASDRNLSYFEASLASGQGVGTFFDSVAQLALPHLNGPKPIYQWPMPEWYKSFLSNPQIATRTPLILNTPPFFPGYLGFCENLFRVLPPLSSISLERCRLCDTGLSYLTDVIANNKTILSLNLGNNYLTAASLAPFLSSLEAHNFSLCSLMLSEQSNTWETKKNVEETIYGASPGTKRQPISDAADSTSLQALIVQRIAPFVRFNMPIRQVLDGKSRDLKLVVDTSRRSQSGTSMPLKTLRLGSMFSLMTTSLVSLTIENWYPLSNPRDHSLPAPLFTLVNLEALTFKDCVDPSDYRNTFFDSLPNDVIRLPKLKYLTFMNCGMLTVTTESSPALPGLSNLQSLSLRRNLLQRLPDAIANCKMLTRLDLSYNMLPSLPMALLQLTHLRSFDVAHNRLMQVPVSLTKQLSGLEDLRIMQQGTDANLSTLVSDSDEAIKIIRLNEKIMEALPTVSFPEVLDHQRKCISKTDAIRLNTFSLVSLGGDLICRAAAAPSNDELECAFTGAPLRGSRINDKTWTNSANSYLLRVRAATGEVSSGILGFGGCYTFTCREFATPDSFPALHPFLATESSCFIVNFVCSPIPAEQERHLQRLDLWLNFVATSFPSAYCLLLGTHADSISEKERLRLKETLAKYQEPARRPKKAHSKRTSMEDFCVHSIDFVSSRSISGDLARVIKPFPAHLQHLRLDGVRDPRRPLRLMEQVPVKWHFLFERAKALVALQPFPAFAWTQWSSLASDEYGMSVAETEQATRHWHANGSLLWFENEAALKGSVVLSPQFVADAFAVITNPSTGLLDMGALPESWLAKTWPQIPASDHAYLIALFQKFELMQLVGGSEAKKVLLCAKPSSSETSAAPSRPSNPWVTSSAPNASGKPQDARAGSPQRKSTIGLSPVEQQSWPYKPSRASPPSNVPAVGLGAPQPSSPTLGQLSPTSLGYSSTQLTPISPTFALTLSALMTACTGRCYVVPALLSHSVPTEPSLPPTGSRSGVRDYMRTYAFNFVPNGFFSRLLVRILQSHWKLLHCWQDGFVISHDTETVHMTHSIASKSLTLRIRGAYSTSRVGALFSAVSALLDDWIAGPDQLAPSFTVSVQHIPDSLGQAPETFDLPALEKLSQQGSSDVILADGLSAVALEYLAPDVVISSMTPCKRFTPDELLKGKQLSRGSFGEVVQASMLDGTHVAIKKLFQATESSSNSLTLFSDFRHEIWLMHQLRHPNLVRLIGMATEPEHIMVLEFMDGGTLHDYVHLSEHCKALSLEEKCDLALGIAQGMNYLHTLDPPIIHRDLKSPNVLLTFYNSDENGRHQLKVPRAKIADFGTSVPLAFSPAAHKCVVDNFEWLAPEAISRQPYNEKADVYAFGIILYEIAARKRFSVALSQEHLNGSEFNTELARAVIAGLRPALPREISPVLTSLIERCWAPNPAERPSFETVIQHLLRRTPLEQAASTTPVQPTPSRPTTSPARSPSISAQRAPAASPDSQPPNDPMDHFVFDDPDMAEPTFVSLPGTPTEQLLNSEGARLTPPIHSTSASSFPRTTTPPMSNSSSDSLQGSPSQGSLSPSSSNDSLSSNPATPSSSSDPRQSPSRPSAPKVPMRLPSEHTRTRSRTDAVTQQVRTPSKPLQRTDRRVALVARDIMPGSLDASHLEEYAKADAWLQANQGLNKLSLPSLHFAAQQGRAAVMEMLIKLGRAAVTDFDPIKGMQPLHYAVESDNSEALAIFKDTDLNSLTRDGYSALHLSIMAGKRNSLQWLIKNGASANMSTASGALPIHLACLYGHRIIISDLLATGATLDSVVVGTGGKPRSLDKLHLIPDASKTLCPGMTPLHFACLGGHVDIVQWLTHEQGSKVDASTVDGRQALHFASQSPSHTLIELLLSRGASPLAVDFYGFLPIHYAAASGRLSVVDLFVKNDINPLARSLLETQPFHLACYSGSRLLVEYLLHKKAAMELKDKHGMLPIHYAAAGGSLELLNHLRTPTNLHATTLVGEHALHFACLHGRLPLVEWLVSQDFDSNSATATSKRPLHFACQGGSLPVAQWLYSRHPALDIEDNYKMQPLHHAAASGSLPLTQWLVKTAGNAALASRTSSGWQPIHFAAQSGNLELIRYMVSNGAAVDSQETDQGWQAVHFAAAGGHLAAVAGLEALGARIHALSKDFYYPVHCAAREGHLNVIAWLADRGAVLNSETLNGQQAIHLAAERGFTQIVGWLLDHGCSVDATDKNGWQPLHWAANKNRLDLVEFLVLHGANISRTDKSGNLPFALATADAVKLLLNPQSLKNSKDKRKSEFKAK